MKHPLDDPRTTLEHAKRIKAKPYLYNLYREYYLWFKKRLSPIAAKTIVELGSGGGFIKDVMPHTITSDVLRLPHIDQQFSALSMPFGKTTVDGFVMINVLHHLKNARRFFREANRCLKANGKILMVEPANTWWGRFIYQNFHHEPFKPNATWGISLGGALSGANGALPWIVFFRDRKIFEKEFPHLQIVSVRPHTPLRYLVSGGVSFGQFLPTWTYPIILWLEQLFAPWNHLIGMFYAIEIKKV